MTDTSKQIDEFPDINSMDDLMNLETLLSREARENAGQNVHVAKMAAQPGDLLSGKTGEAIKRLDK